MAGNSGQKPMAEPVVRSRITINYLSDGRVHVNGPLNDQILCLGLLRKAEEIILNYKGPVEEKRIVVPDLTGVSVPGKR